MTKYDGANMNDDEVLARKLQQEEESSARKYADYFLGKMLIIGEGKKSLSENISYAMPA